MRTLRISVALIAVVACSAMIATSASAAGWFRGSEEIRTTESVDWHGELVFHHTGGFAGSVLILCTVLSHGTVGASGKDELTKFLGLNNQLDNWPCVVHTGNGLCAAGTNITVSAKGLPWATQLSTGTPITDAATGTGGEVGYSTTCNGITIECRHNEVLNFSSNGTNGAIFEDPGTGKASCSDGGTGTLLGKMEVLGFTVK